MALVVLLSFDNQLRQICQSLHKLLNFHLETVNKFILFG